MFGKRKKKASGETMLRQVQDSLQVMPYYIDQQRAEGRWFKAFMLRYVSTPVLRVMNRALGARRYKGEQGVKRRQTDMMRRHLQQKQAARKQIQEMMQTSEPAEVMRQVNAMRQKTKGAKKKGGSTKKCAKKDSGS
jgi:hypothetical protein